MEKLALVTIFALFAVAFGYTNEQVAAYADTNGDGIISDEEFTNWHDMAMSYKKTATIFEFTGPIAVDYFEFVLWYWQQQGYFSPEFSIEDAVKYANENNDHVIDAAEFDKWYGGVVYYSAQALKGAMAGADGVITVEEFVNILNAIPM